MNKGANASPCSVRRSRRPQTRLETSCTRTGRPRRHLRSQPDSRSAGEGSGRTARAYVCEESHSGVLPMNHSNKDTRLSAESGEGRPLIKENAGQSNTYPTQSGDRVSQGLAGVRKAAREHKEMKFTALLHHLTVDLLRESFYSLKRKAAPGVDGVTWQEYESGLENRLVDLHGRVHRGAYRALPSRRMYIQKEDGRQRPLGVAAVEDKIVQQAVVTILNQIYEEDFLGFSYGFRPGRSQHDALDALSYALLKKKVNYILDADIRGFFDNLDKSWLIKFMEHRVADPRILRLIRKWLKAGVMEEGKWSEPQTGTPQGSVISPLLANVYLHYSFDLWGNVWRQKWAQGEVIVGKGNLRRSISWASNISVGRTGWGDSPCDARRSASACEPSFENSSNSFACTCMIPCLKRADGSNWSCRATSTTTRYQGTSRAWPCSGTDCWGCGGELFVAGASNATYRGPGCLRWVDDGYLHRACSIPIPQFASPPVI